MASVYGLDKFSEYSAGRHYPVINWQDDLLIESPGKVQLIKFIGKNTREDNCTQKLQVNSEGTPQIQKQVLVKKYMKMGENFPPKMVCVGEDPKELHETIIRAMQDPKR